LATRLLPCGFKLKTAGSIVSSLLTHKIMDIIIDFSMAALKSIHSRKFAKPAASPCCLIAAFTSRKECYEAL